MQIATSRALLLVLLLATLAPAAQATLEQPTVLFQAELPFLQLQDGDSFVIPVDLHILEDATVAEIVLKPDLRSARLGFEVSPQSTKASPPRYRSERRLLTGTLEPGLDRIRFQVTANGEVWEDRIHLRQIGDPEEELVLADPAKLPAESKLDPSDFSRPDPIPSGFPTADPSTFKAPRIVRVHGRIMMQPNGTGPLRGVDGITVYFMQVRDILDDIELGSDTTDVLGNFEFDVPMDGTHDVYVKVRALNSVVNVGTDAGFQTYGFNHPITRNFSGTDFALGASILNARMNQPAWILSTITRAHRWYMAGGFTLPQVNCRWWDDVLGSSVYLPIEGMAGMHLRSSASWRSETVVHEYGHHFVYASPVQEVWPPYYTNGICDPGHCGWCQENEAVAWSEGLPYFLQQEINADHLGTYGWEQPNDRTYESLQTCDETEVFGAFPAKTELFFAAFLNDLIDTRSDNSLLQPTVYERSELDLFDILFVASTQPISNSVQFVDAMRDHLSTLYTDEQRQEFWAAAAINGFDYDFNPPTRPTSISTPTHIPGLASASNLPIMEFIGATDDRSGVEFYKVAIMDTPAPPDSTALLVRETTLTWPTPLAEGTYHINVTVLDRAGNESLVFSKGPIIVGPPDPLDLVMFPPGLWEDSFLIRHTPDVTSAAGAAEPTLFPNQDFWMSLTSRNESAGSGTVPNFAHRVVVDNDVLIDQDFSPGVMTSNQEFQVLNHGPHQLGPGRHHFEILLDADQVVAEDDNFNNIVDRFFVFRPEILAAGPWQLFPRAPAAFTAPTYRQIHPNVAGHRIAPTNDFAGVMLATASTGTQYSLRLHPISTGPDNGFESPITVSDNPDTEIETIILNASALGASSFDVGARRHAEGSITSYSMRHVESSILNPGDSTSLFWTDQDDLSLLEFTFNTLETGPFTVTVDATFQPFESFPELRFYWIDPSIPTVRPHSDAPDGITDEDGNVALELNVPAPGTYCLAVFRDTRLSGVAQGVTIDIETSTVPQPDLTIFRDNHFWDLPFIPRIDPQSGPVLTLPSLLTDEPAGTILNFNLQNTGQLDALNVDVQVELDGQGGGQFFSTQISKMNQFESVEFYGDYGHAITVSGGRHTLTLSIDPGNQIPERNENNNVFSMQFGWQGLAMTLGANLNHLAPPDPAAGFSTLEQFDAVGIDGGDQSATVPINAIAPNCDGFRLPAFTSKATGSWIAVGAMPGATSNVDLQLHEVLAPAQAFTLPIAESTWDLGESDFVLIDRNAISPREFDVGVLGIAGSENYDLIAVQSLKLTTPPTVQGPFGMDGGQFLHLYEITLAAGDHTIKLSSPNGTADLGLSVYPPTPPLNAPFWSKEDGRDRVPMSYLAPAGQPELVVVDVEHGEEGVYCIAVWKTSAAGLAVNDDYTLEFTENLAAAPCVVIDGQADATHGPAASVQTTQTTFGDANQGLPDAANGSELDQAYAVICDGILYLTLTGNLESNFNDLEIFIDSGPGGQNSLRGDNFSIGGGPGLNRMGDDGSGNGLTFDALFEPDWWFGVQGGFGDASGANGIPYKMMVYQAELLTAGGGAGRYLGATVAQSGGILAGFGADNPDGVRATIDNSNTVGVTAGTGASSGAGVVRGVELAIPLAAIGDPTECLRISAFLNGQEHDFVSNQVLGPLPVGTDFLGEPRDVDFSQHAGNQYFTVCQDGVTGIGDDLPGRPKLDMVLHPAAPNPFNPRTTLSFTLAHEAEVQLTLFDLAGRRVRTFLAGHTVTAGRHELIWTGQDERGRTVASGSYLLRLTADGQTQTRSLTLLK